MVNYIKWTFLDRFCIGKFDIHEHLQEFSTFISQKGAPLDCIVGFMDGTARAISRPSQFQQAFYSGYYKMHCLKFQSIAFPNGMIYLNGPFVGCKNDLFMLRESRIREELYEKGKLNLNGKDHYIYCDSGYVDNEFILTGFSKQQLINDKGREEFNRKMSSCREVVEWGFGKIITLFAFLDFNKNLKLLSQPVADYYFVGLFLSNCHTCIYGSQINNYFNSDPPTLEEVFGSIARVESR